METSEISLQQVKIYDFVKGAKGWVSSKDIVKATDCARETVGVHCRKFVSLGVFDQAEVWPGHRYRVAKLADKRNKSIVKRLEDAKAVFGL